MVNPAITNLAIVLGMMQVSKKIPFEDPTVLLAVRVLYVVSNLIIFGLYYFISTKIKARKDLTTLKYLEPSQPGSGEPEKLVTTTVMEYDLGEVQKAYKAQLMGVGMMAFMHLYMGYVNPLLLQSLLPVKSLFEANLVKIWILNKPAVGELKRPWKAAAGFMGMGGGEVKTDKASIEAAERAGRGGAKEE